MSAGSGANAFPWDAVMAFGLGQLRLSPRDFWAMTPREIGCAMSRHGQATTAPPGREALQRLMTAFPDGGPDRGPDRG